MGSATVVVEVAELAGVPPSVVDRARDLVAADEAGRDRRTGGIESGPRPDGEATGEDGATGRQGATDADRDGDASLREFLAEEASDERAAGGDRPDGSTEAPSEGDGTRDAEDAEEGAAHGAPTDLAAALRDLDLARMTPIEALNALHDLQSRIDDDG